MADPRSDGQLLAPSGETYELLGEIAAGGMGTVFLARLRRPMGFARLVAVKCMRPEYAGDPQFSSMFLDEARLAARLHHPNIVPTLDVVSENGQLLIVMEYVDGASAAALAETLEKARATLPIEIACALVHDALLGLHEAHSARDENGAPLGVVHRDVSPQNVLVGLDGLARVLDFGIAKAHGRLHSTTDHALKGKIRYMPPEQVFGESIDHRADIYAAGVVLWELLCGRPLFTGRPEVVAAKISEGVIPPPSTRAEGVTPELDRVVLRALAHDPGARFDSALAMAEAIAAQIKLPHRTEIATWVRRWVKPRPIPSAAPPDGELLASGVATGAIVAALERGTGARERRPTDGTDLFPMTSSIAAGASRPSIARRARRVVPTVLAIASLATAVLALAGQRGPVRHEATPLPAAAAPPLPAPAPPVANDGARAAVAAALPHAALAATPSVAAAPPPPPRAVPRAGRVPSAACKPPYYLDAHGKRRFRAECL